MVAPVETGLQRRRDRHREMCVRFSSRASLLSGFARAQSEPWIEDCRVDLPRRELWIRMAGGFHVQPALRGRGALRALGGARAGGPRRAGDALGR
jgi:hypothetical protein